MVIYENIRVIERAIDVYGNMQVMQRPYYCMIPCKSYAVLKYGHSMEGHAKILSDYDNVFLRTNIWLQILMKNFTLKREVQNLWQ